MLELRNLFLTIDRADDPLDLLHDVSFRAPGGHFMAIVGASGCGKTTLLKTIAGLAPETSGEVRWNGRNLATEGDLLPNEFAYVPQFSIAYDQLTVEESVESAARLRVRCRTREEEDAIIERSLEDTGLAPIAGRRVSVISGGQKRRLGLAMEMVADPALLLCDEVTSGLDPKTEQEIVSLMHTLSRKGDRLVVNVTHSLANLDLHDSVLVLHSGKLVYHGPPKLMSHYFSVTHPEEIYKRLANRNPEKWHRSWCKHRPFYYEAMGLEPPVKGHDIPEHATTALEEAVAPPEQPDVSNPSLTSPASEAGGAAPFAPEEKEAPDAKANGESAAVADAATLGDRQAGHSKHQVPPSPGLIAQSLHLFGRRWRIFFRDRTQLFLHVAILFGFPALVTLFAVNAPPSPKVMTGVDAGALDFAIQQRDVFLSQLVAGGFASGLIMFQVILLTLMGSNNSAREIAGERMIYEKEKLAGLRPSAYLASKIAFLSVPVLLQAVWMGLFVQIFWAFPGEITSHLISLVAVTAAMTAVCLGISANMRSADQANLLSVYLVGFQLPLSGILLALPQFIETFVRPFISAFWSWSSSVDALSREYYTAVDTVTDTALQSAPIGLFVLGLHIVVGLFAAYIGSRKTFWD